MNASLCRKLIVEFIGTFFLVYVIGCVSLQAHVLLGPLAIGASLMVMIFAGGHISGGHYNPAVTLGVWIRGACSALEAGFYLVAQVIGAIVAALAAEFLLGHGSSPAASTVTVAQVMLAEALGTFALVYTVLNVATAPATAGNSFYGLAIGFTVFAQAVAVGKVSGGAFNPLSPLALLCSGWPMVQISGSIGSASFSASVSQRFSFSLLIKEDCTSRQQPPMIERRSQLTKLSALCSACLAARHV